MQKQHWLRYGICGAAAGAVNGLFGAGGGMVLVPMLIRFAGLEDKKAFSSATANASIPEHARNACLSMRSTPAEM